MMRCLLRWFLWLSLASICVPGGRAQTDIATTVRWYGHAFIYVISSTGVRVAIDPFGENALQYKFPDHLTADVVLVSNEADDHSGADRLFGSPQLFRSVTAVGLNNARGHLFKGVSTFRDNRKGALLGGNTIFSFKLDGVRFAHLGSLGHTLDSRQRQDLGPVDVLFLPVGRMEAADLNQIIDDLGAKIIVPIEYDTQFTTGLPLRKLEEFLDNQKKPVKKTSASEFNITPATLPAVPTIYVLPVP